MQTFKTYTQIVFFLAEMEIQTDLCFEDMKEIYDIIREDTYSHGIGTLFVLLWYVHTAM